MLEQTIQKLVEALLRQVPEHGFTMAALLKAADDVGMAATATQYIPDVATLLEVVGKQIDRRMEACYAAAPTPSGTYKKIRLLLLCRFTGMDKDRVAFQRYALHFLLPHRLGLGTRIAAKSVDSMWRLAEDRSCDENFYSKRIILGLVLKEATRRWLLDSYRQEKLESIIDDALAISAAIGKWKARLPRPGPACLAKLTQLRYGS